MRHVSIAAAAALLLALSPAPAAAQFPIPPVQAAEPGPEGRRVTDDGLIANYFPADAPGPAILLLGGSEGGLTEGGVRTAEALRAEGFSVLQLSYFRAPGQSSRLEHVPLEYFGTALAWLARQPEVDGGRIGILGGSKGAEAALLVAVRHPVKAVVAGMPSSVAWPGIVWEGMDGAIGSSWSEGGRPLPHLPYGRPEAATTIGAVYEAGLARLGDHPDAAIPVERIAAPVLLVCGEADTLWPACPMARQLVDRARAHGRPDVRLLAYENAGHAVYGRPVPEDDPRLPGLAALGGTPEGNNAARADGWPRILAFLKEALGK
ncbi:MAG: acyl-CoA thioester hydrolase/BAAT C-terminal domain-containing protein [Allosphingosinicella sp.]|uniref:acyl-CoA thioester hydrolase/BAAT C-terminal domain-containing protein n=1 Tax=Allosphingosinicella sp. TaxID=2823234 RepID=UPI00394CB263